MAAPEGRRKRAEGKAQRRRQARRVSPPPLRGGLHIDDANHGLRSLRSLHPWQPSSAPPGREKDWAPVTTGCARVARFTRGNQPPPLRGGRSVHISGSIAPPSQRRSTYVAPEGRWTVATGGAEPEAQRNPWKVARIDEPPRRGGGDVRRSMRLAHRTLPPPLRGGLHLRAADHGLRSLRSLHPWQHPSAPPGRSQYRRRFPRVALAALASPVATVLRPSGAESMLATLSTGCARCARFTRGNIPSPLRGGPIRARQPFKRVASLPTNDFRRPGGAQECCHGWSGAEGAAQPVESRAN